MEYGIEYVRGKKEGLKVLQNINSVRKYKSVLLPYELVGENGRHLTQCGRVIEEKGSMLSKVVNMCSKKPTKGSRKV